MTEVTYGRGVAESWINPAIIEAGITSGDKYYDWLRESNLYVPRATVREVWKEYGEATRYADVISRWNPERAIPRAWYAESSSEYIDRYGTRVAITEQDPITGEETTQTYLFKSDRPSTPSEVEEWATSLTPDASPPIEGAVVGVAVEAVYHRTGTHW